MSKNQLHPVQECYLAGIQNKTFSVKEKPSDWGASSLESKRWERRSLKKVKELNPSERGTKFCSNNFIPPHPKDALLDWDLVIVEAV